METDDGVLEIRDLTKVFKVTSPGFVRRGVGWVRAVDHVDLRVRSGATVALVGETGCGKTTLARCVVRLIDPTGGTVHVAGQEVSRARGRALRDLRRNVQMVFQDPYSSLNPRRTVGSILSTSLRLNTNLRGEQLQSELSRLMETVGLDPDQLDRYPHEFSGGQRQRIGIARALAVRPKLVICDEPVSALDVSIQSQILNLLKRLQRDLGVSFLLISHDLAVVRQMADEVAVMYLGQIVEHATNDEIFGDPRHPYTRALLSAIPRTAPTADVKRLSLRGEPPSPTDLPEACRFHPRCPQATELCSAVVPTLRRIATTHAAACHYADDGVTTTASEGASR
jgi:oligopeptide/dipeptide ABC transporter ATP-binding protein